MTAAKPNRKDTKCSTLCDSVMTYEGSLQHSPTIMMPSTEREYAKKPNHSDTNARCVMPLMFIRTECTKRPKHTIQECH